MKTIATISIFFLCLTSLFAFDLKTSVEPLPYKTLSSYNNGSSTILNFPWADAQSVIMEKVYSKDEYSLWKCESQIVTNFPGQKIHGKLYHYFVYKNGRFHLTVTEMNKECVFSFFTDGNQKSKFPKHC
jgi:hypothetical protein